ncbi:MAG: hypothetical protein KDJ16_05180 [Hyphomicrobiales bacterium]|nr:hypothetical protein [Hyphomicrobiales bacterium]
MNRLRLVPVVVIAATALLILKTAALISNGGYVLTGTGFAVAQQPAADGKTAADGEAAGDMKMAENGSGGAETDTEKTAPTAPALDLGREVTPGVPIGAEAALLQRLGERRAKLDALEQELKLRESLLAATEKRVEERVNELKALEEKLGGDADKKDQARKEEYGNLITMYENMKAKDAAEVFDRMEIDVLVDLVKQMNPRKVAPIVARMAPDAAERLTVAIATQSRKRPSPTSGELPKIEGRPLETN